MAKDKKSFVLYADMIHAIEYLTNEEKGILFQHILEYVNDINPIMEDRLILTAWKPIELQLKRDLIKYEHKRKQYSEAGKRSAELRKAKKDQRLSTNVESVNDRSTKSTVNDTVNDTVNVINKEKDKKKIVANAPVSKSNKIKTYKQWTNDDFKKVLNLFRGEHTDQTLKDFYSYWSEPTASGKMRLTTNKSWDTSRRLKTWTRNNFNNINAPIDKNKYNARR